MGRLDGTVCIFDLDGTLVDSAPDLTAALNRALLKHGLEEMVPSEVRPMVGEGARALLKLGHERQGRQFPEGAEADRMVTEYIEDYAERISELSFVFPNAAQVLDELAEEGAALAVCTNKVERLAVPLLRDMGLYDRFGIVVAADSLLEKKPSAVPLLHILERLDARRGVMIGDTLTDFRAAEAARMPCLIAGFGYGALDPELGDARKFDDFAELPGLVTKVIRSAA